MSSKQGSFDNNDNKVGKCQGDNNNNNSDKVLLCTEEVVTKLSVLSCNAKPSKASHDTLRRASVLILLLDDSGEAHLLFTVRSKKLRSHPGDVCFPGGKRQEDIDGSDIDTALRETKEEISLSSSSIEIICTLPTVQSINQLCVTPIVGRYIISNNKNTTYNILDELTLCPTEVETAFLAPLHIFLNPNGDEPLNYMEWDGDMFPMRAYHYSNTHYNNNSKKKTFRIWGLTAYMAHTLACIADYNQPLSSSMNAQDIIQIIENTNKEEKDKKKSNHQTRTPTDTSSHVNSAQTIKQQQQQEGYLHFLVQKDQQSASHWNRQYFVLSGTYNSKNTSSMVTRNRSVLHRFASQSDSLKKKNSATKKNRLLLHNTYFNRIHANDDTTTIITKQHSLYYFQISAYNDQIVWNLAADDHPTFLSWKELLQASGCQYREIQP